MNNRFPMEFFQELVRKNMLRSEDTETTIPDFVTDDQTEDMFLSQKTLSEEDTEII